MLYAGGTASKVARRSGAGFMLWVLTALARPAGTSKLRKGQQQDPESVEVS